MAQRVKKYKGQILINDKPIDKSFRALSAYVQQDDVLMGNLTVRETLRYAAILRLPSSVSIKTKMKKVDEVMDELGLTKSADSVVGIPGFVKGISGGERKRLAIATELLTEPSVLFLDEVRTSLFIHNCSLLLV
jgi:ABC-type multidrug transport system ATPase subunit